MSNYVFIGPGMMGQVPMSQTDTAQRYELGLEVFARDVGNLPLTGSAASSSVGSGALGGGVFRYVQGGATSVSAQGQLVAIQGNSVFPVGSAHKASAFPVGVAAGAISATSVFGWVQVQGMCDYARISNHDIAVGAQAFLASTAGLLATTNTATNDGRFIVGIGFPVSATSTQSASITCDLNRPFIAAQIARC